MAKHSTRALRRSVAMLGAAMMFMALPAHAKHQRHHPRANAARVSFDANGNTLGVIGGRPAGCPRAFCGCGLRKYLGLADKRLDLAWNWARLFPRTHAHPGAAAVRAHHVMLLVEHIAGPNWLVRDYNGGHHLAYIHERNVSGYVFVEPNARIGMN